MIPQNIQNYSPPGEQRTGETWLGQPVYRRFFRGTTPTNGTTTVLAPPSAGIGIVIRMSGWIYETDPGYVAVEAWCVNGTAERVLVRVQSTGLTMLTNSAGVFVSRPYEMSVDYIRGNGFGTNLV